MEDRARVVIAGAGIVGYGGAEHLTKLGRRKVVVLDDPSVVITGSEPVYAEGRPVGYITSAAYGYSIGQSIAYAWPPPGLSEEGTKVEIEYFGKRHGATVAEEPPFDPAMNRMRG